MKMYSKQEECCFLVYDATFSIEKICVESKREPAFLVY